MNHVSITTHSSTEWAFVRFGVSSAKLKLIDEAKALAYCDKPHKTHVQMRRGIIILKEPKDASFLNIEYPNLQFYYCRNWRRSLSKMGADRTEIGDMPRVVRGMPSKGKGRLTLADCSKLDTIERWDAFKLIMDEQRAKLLGIPKIEQMDSADTVDSSPGTDERQSSMKREATTDVRDGNKRPKRSNGLYRLGNK